MDRVKVSRRSCPVRQIGRDCGSRQAPHAQEAFHASWFLCRILTAEELIVVDPWPDRPDGRQLGGRAARWAIARPGQCTWSWPWCASSGSAAGSGSLIGTGVAASGALLGAGAGASTGWAAGGGGAGCGS